jgi:hypothetical protein
MRVDLFTILASDHKELTKMQTKLNQWLTDKSLKKYNMYTTATHVIFNVCRLKEKGE